MMKFLSHSPKRATYSSIAWRESQTIRGVRYAIRRVSLAQRIELANRVQELLLKHEFLRAGDSADQVQANLAELLIQKLYIEWGLAEIKRLVIDGVDATADSVIEKGPELLAREIVAAIREQMELSEDERKNS